MGDMLERVSKVMKHTKRSLNTLKLLNIEFYPYHTTYEIQDFKNRKVYRVRVHDDGRYMCECTYYAIHGICIHIIYVMKLRGEIA